MPLLLARGRGIWILAHIAAFYQFFLHCAFSNASPPPSVRPEGGAVGPPTPAHTGFPGGTGPSLVGGGRGASPQPPFWIRQESVM